MTTLFLKEPFAAAFGKNRLMTLIKLLPKRPRTNESSGKNFRVYKIRVGIVIWPRKELNLIQDQGGVVACLNICRPFPWTVEGCQEPGASCTKWQPINTTFCFDGNTICQKKKWVNFAESLLNMAGFPFLLWVDLATDPVPEVVLGAPSPWFLSESKVLLLSTLIMKAVKLWRCRSDP